MKNTTLTLLALSLSASVAAHQNAHEGHIVSGKKEGISPTFDIVHAKVVKNGTSLTFQTEVVGEADATVKSGNCAFCHTTADLPQYDQELNQNGYAIYKLEGYPE